MQGPRSAKRREKKGGTRAAGIIERERNVFNEFCKGTVATRMAK